MVADQKRVNKITVSESNDRKRPFLSEAKLTKIALDRFILYTCYQTGTVNRWIRRGAQGLSLIVLLLVFCPGLNLGLGLNRFRVPS